VPPTAPLDATLPRSHTGRIPEGHVVIRFTACRLRLQLVNPALIELSDSMLYSRPPQGLGFAVAWSRRCDDGKVPNVDSVRVANFTGGLTTSARGS
jgi:hypothetical protein